jgi:hypothetical protein
VCVCVCEQRHNNITRARKRYFLRCANALLAACLEAAARRVLRNLLARRKYYDAQHSSI